MENKKNRTIEIQFFQTGAIRFYTGEVTAQVHLKQLRSVCFEIQTGDSSEVMAASLGDKIRQITLLPLFPFKPGASSGLIATPVIDGVTFSAVLIDTFEWSQVMAVVDEIAEILPDTYRL